MATISANECAVRGAVGIAISRVEEMPLTGADVVLRTDRCEEPEEKEDGPVEIWLRPDDARSLAAILLAQADQADRINEEEE